MNDLTLREEWIAGQKCEIYSISKDQWFTGKIHDIFIDDEGEWLEIRYNKSCSKQVQRYSVNVRPHPKYYDKFKLQLLVNGYIRMIQFQCLLSKMIPHSLNIIFFSFYFVGDSFLSDDAEISSEEDDNYNCNDNNHNHHLHLNQNNIYNDDNESLSPSPESKNLAIEYLKKQIEEKNRKRRIRHKNNHNNTHRFVYPATRSIRFLNNKLWDISENEQFPKIQLFDDDDYIDIDNNNNINIINVDNYYKEWQLDIIRDDILCTMTDILFEIGTMFKTKPIQNITSSLKKQIIQLKDIINIKQKYRKELIVFGFINEIINDNDNQNSIKNNNKMLIFPVDVKKLCLSYYI